MKKITLLLMVVVAFTACDNIEQFRQPIQELATNWEATTAKVTELMGQVNSEQVKAEAMVKRLEISESTASTLSDDVKAQAAELQSTFKSKMGELSNMKEGLNGFVSTWQEKSAELNALKEGLEAGKLPEGAAGTISSLQEMLATATTNLGEWTTQFEAIRGSFSEIYNKFVEVKGTMPEAPTE